jgi:hypothetical protein
LGSYYDDFYGLLGRYLCGRLYRYLCGPLYHFLFGLLYHFLCGLLYHFLCGLLCRCLSFWVTLDSRPNDDLTFRNCITYPSYLLLYSLLPNDLNGHN